MNTGKQQCGRQTSRQVLSKGLGVRAALYVAAGQECSLSNQQPGSVASHTDLGFEHVTCFGPWEKRTETRRDLKSTWV